MAIYNDKKYINKNTILSYAKTNETFLKGEVKGVIIELPGLDGCSCLGGNLNLGDYDTEHAKDFAEYGIILAYMFPGPWSWGNKSAIRMTNAVVDAIADKYNLKEGFPLVVSGGSMGGLGTLNFIAGTTRKVTAAAVACPVMDALYSMGCHPEFPRTLLSAVGSYDMDYEDALETISPVHKIGEMPSIKYYISSDGDDELIPEVQIENYAKALKDKGCDVIYRPQPGLKHGQFTKEVWNEQHEFMIRAILG
ncbi:MAG: prolyl oligopeptidase family serine peptidase [Clostridia bacterium]|nr:prolyl oligopeptidase family serine peptidase [Clostridia bacterium]